MFGVVYAYRGPQKLLKKYSNFRQRSPDIPKENKKFQREILRLASEHPIFQFLSLPSLPYLCPGGYCGGRFPSQLCIDQYGGGFTCRQKTLVTSQPIGRFFGSVIYMPNFRSTGPFKQKLQRDAPCPPAIPICKTPGLFRVNQTNQSRDKQI